MIFRSLSKPKSLLSAFREDESGVGAVEFAIIFPLLLVLYICAFELTVAFSMYKRTAYATGMVADLISQKKEVTPALLQTTPNAVRAAFAPYSTDGMRIRITSITTNADGVATVDWSWDERNARPYPHGSSFTIPQSMRTPNNQLIYAELEIPHAVLRFMTTIDTRITPITLRKDYFFQARRSEAPITCKGC